MTDVRSLLFVCTANICRSAYAEVMTRHIVGRRSALQVASAGVAGWNAHPMDDYMAAEAGRRGANPTSFRSQRLTRELIGGSDLVLTASAEHRRWVIDEVPSATRRVFTLGQYAAMVAPYADRPADAAYDAALSTGIDPTGRDVRDPYRRGPAAAAECAATIDRHLRTIIDAIAP